MKSRRLAVAVALGLFAASAWSGDKLEGSLRGLGATDQKTPVRRPAKPMGPAPSRPAGPRADLRIQVEAEYRGMKHAADFVVVDAAQSNYVQGGDKAYAVENAQGKGVEYKKWGFIVNSLAVVDPADPAKVDLQLQVEVSGPVKGDGGIDVETWQLQTEAVLVKGRRTEVSSGEGKAAVTVTETAD